MVATAEVSPNVAFTGADRLNKNVSLPSTSVSPINLTVTVLDVSPAAKLSVDNGNPTKSLPAYADAFAVTYFTDTAAPLGLDNDTVNTASDWPELPSTTFTSDT